MIRVHLSNGENVDFYEFNQEAYEGLITSILNVENINTFHIGLTIFNFDKLDYMEWLELTEEDSDDAGI